MTNEDRATSYRVLRYRLFMGGHTNTPDADEETLRRVLLALPYSIKDLYPIVGADGMWAAMNVLGRPQPPLTLADAVKEFHEALLQLFKPICVPVLDWLTKQVRRISHSN